MQIIGWEGAALVLQLPVGRSDRLHMERHARLARGAAAFTEIARAARRGDILPRRPPALATRDHVVEGQFARTAAILAAKLVAQKQVEAREGGILRRFDILFERDDRRDFHRPIGAVDLARIAFDDLDAVEKDRLDRGLPRPQAERVIAQRRIIGVEYQRRALVGMPVEVGMKHLTSSP